MTSAAIEMISELAVVEVLPRDAEGTERGRPPRSAALRWLAWPSRFSADIVSESGWKPTGLLPTELSF